MKAPKVCIIVCEDSLSELVARESLKELGSDVALCPLSEDAAEVRGPTNNTKNAEYVVVVDSCSEECGKKRAKALGVHYDEHLNLEKALGIKMPCSKKPSVEVVDDVGLAAVHLVERVKAILEKL
ncbi:hypothetical protein A3L09_03330 [Thermococcus profundus]|uniref:Zinc-binding protein n=1 Tax=Thermococcus profundus TaxID=49899 RepID=A0A2Z2MIU4_THEPR|nr:putative zinc-binding protein [Thermococcus profundus]ASJ02351.1 hypothetical protein A3L09_03330 [Thermococcus profundus]